MLRNSFYIYAFNDATEYLSFIRKRFLLLYCKNLMKIIVHVFFYATNIDEKIFMEKKNYYVQHDLDATSSARQN